MITQIGKILIFTGFVFILVGFLFLFWQKLPFIGKLPGDIYIKKDNFVFYFPLGTSILISIILSIIFIIWRIFR